MQQNQVKTTASSIFLYRDNSVRFSINAVNPGSTILCMNHRNGGNAVRNSLRSIRAVLFAGLRQLLQIISYHIAGI